MPCYRRPITVRHTSFKIIGQQVTPCFYQTYNRSQFFLQSYEKLPCFLHTHNLVNTFPSNTLNVTYHVSSSHLWKVTILYLFISVICGCVSALSVIGNHVWFELVWPVTMFPSGAWRVTIPVTSIQAKYTQLHLTRDSTVPPDFLTLIRPFEIRVSRVFLTRFLTLY